MGLYTEPGAAHEVWVPLARPMWNWRTATAGVVRRALGGGRRKNRQVGLGPCVQSGRHFPVHTERGITAAGAMNDQ